MAEMTMLLEWDADTDHDEETTIANRDELLARINGQDDLAVLDFLGDAVGETQRLLDEAWAKHRRLKLKVIPANG